MREIADTSASCPFARTAQSRDQSLDARCHDRATHQQRLHHLEGLLDELVAGDGTQLEVAVHGPWTSGYMPGRSIRAEIRQLARDLGIRSVARAQQTIHPEQATPFIGVTHQVGELQEQELWPRNASYTPRPPTTVTSRPVVITRYCRQNSAIASPVFCSMTCQYSASI